MHSYLEAWSWGYKTFFMLNSAEQEILIAHESLNTEKGLFCFQTLNCCIYHANEC